MREGILGSARGGGPGREPERGGLRTLTEARDGDNWRMENVRLIFVRRTA